MIKEYSNIADPMLTVAHKLRLKNANLRRTRDLLLPRLISGDVSVGDLDIDPAGSKA